MLFQTGSSENVADQIWSVLEESWNYDPWERPTAASFEFALENIRGMQNGCEIETIGDRDTLSYDVLEVRMILFLRWLHTNRFSAIRRWTLLILSCRIITYLVKDVGGTL